MERINDLDNFGELTKNRPIFLLGDFNSRPGSDVYKTFVGDENSNNPSLLIDSMKGGKRIDWILYKGNVKVLSYMRMWIIMLMALILPIIDLYLLNLKFLRSKVSIK